MTPNTRRTTATVSVLVLLVLGAVVPAPAAAQSAGEEDGFDIPSPIEWAQDSTAYQTVAGVLARVQYEAAHTVGLGSETTASDTVTDLRDYADGEQETAILAYANTYIPDDVAKTGYDVLRLDLEAGGESRTVYVTANVTDGNFTDVAVVNATDRTVDYTLSADEFATRELPGDVAWVYSEYVSTDVAPDGAAKARFASKYGGHINVTEGDA